MRRAAKTDANHAEIRDYFRSKGCIVVDMSSFGRGVPDLLVQIGGLTMPVEIKTAKGKLTEAQKKCPLMMRVVRDKAGADETIATLERWCRTLRNNLTHEELYEQIERLGDKH